jgi:hypothetical protein
MADPAVEKNNSMQRDGTGEVGFLMAQSAANPPERLRYRGFLLPWLQRAAGNSRPLPRDLFLRFKYGISVLVVTRERVSFLASTAIFTQHITSEQ